MWFWHIVIYMSAYLENMVFMMAFHCSFIMPSDSYLQLYMKAKNCFPLSITSDLLPCSWSVVVRTLSGHRSNCTAVEFHPFGEFFASGSRDTNLKIWDIRKKGCIHTYKGHTQGISTIKFTPDGRWVVSGGFDSAVKVIWSHSVGGVTFYHHYIKGHILKFLLNRYGI